MTQRRIEVEDRTYALDAQPIRTSLTDGPSMLWGFQVRILDEAGRELGIKTCFVGRVSVQFRDPEALEGPIEGLLPVLHDLRSRRSSLAWSRARPATRSSSPEPGADAAPPVGRARSRASRANDRGTARQAAAVSPEITSATPAGPARRICAARRAPRARSRAARAATASPARQASASSRSAAWARRSSCPALRADGPARRRGGRWRAGAGGAPGNRISWPGDEVGERMFVVCHRGRTARPSRRFSDG